MEHQYELGSGQPQNQQVASAPPGNDGNWQHLQPPMLGHSESWSHHSGSSSSMPMTAWGNVREFQGLEEPESPVHSATYGPNDSGHNAHAAGGTDPRFTQHTAHSGSAGNLSQAAQAFGNEGAFYHHAQVTGHPAMLQQFGEVVNPGLPYHGVPGVGGMPRGMGMPGDPSTAHLHQPARFGAGGLGGAANHLHGGHFPVGHHGMVLAGMAPAVPQFTDVKRPVHEEDWEDEFSVGPGDPG